MAKTRKKPQQLLAQSLKAASNASRGNIVKSSYLDRKYRERLINAGFLTEVIRGWYLLRSADGDSGSTAWFGGFWAFLQYYLDDRFGKNKYCLSAESSFNLYAGDTFVPKQIIVLTQKASNTTISLPHNTSILLLTDSKNFPDDVERINGITRMSLPFALSRLTPTYYRKNPRNIEIVLKISSLSVSEISRTLLKTENIASAERIIGAYKYLGEVSKSEQIRGDISAAGYILKDINPFDEYLPKLAEMRFSSPYVGRIRLMWNEMRLVVIDNLPSSPGVVGDKKQTIEVIQETYKQDAYHSLSIEGYQVTEELISKIESGEWDPENIIDDRKQRDALAAKGYHNAFQEVIMSITKVLNGESSGSVLSNDLQKWYRQLFTPLLVANLLEPEKVVGYRNHPVYISNSRHVPPPSSAVLECMETLFQLLKEEHHAGVRAILGHFIFVFIHPYMDGNGRIARFIMNLMLISGGYPWAIIRTENREKYMSSLELASTKEDIGKFAKFIASEIK